MHKKRLRKQAAALAGVYAAGAALSAIAGIHPGRFRVRWWFKGGSDLTGCPKRTGARLARLLAQCPPKHYPLAGGKG